MFLYEKDLKEAFWEKYKTRNNIKSYAFEIGRSGGMDLVTLEYFRDMYEYNSFEFKLENISKAILQAKYNLKYVNKSWIVMPEEKKEVITNKYYMDIKANKGMGVMLVNESGYYDILIKPMPNEEMLINQEMIRLAVNSKRQGKENFKMKVEKVEFEITRNINGKDMKIKFTDEELKNMEKAMGFTHEPMTFTEFLRKNEG